MNILLTGASGQLGTELYPMLSELGKVTAVDRNPGPLGSVSLDLGDLLQTENLLNRQRPDLVVNAAAYTAVDQAENNRELAFRLNSELPACLARWSASRKSPLLHFSTDYVFDGSSDRAYREDDRGCPINVYGDSKLAGELAIQSSGCKHLIVRTSWVYSTHGNNFLLTMMRLARERPELGVVSDQTGCPTWARSLARASRQLLQAVQSKQQWDAYGGVYHYCDSTVTTWYDFASRIFEQALEMGLLEAMPVLKAIQSSDFPQLAERPRFSVLDTAKMREYFGIIPPDLDESLKECLKDYRP